MNILVTGANGFVGKNLVEELKCVKEKKNLTRPGLFIEEIYEYDRTTDPRLLEDYCGKADFVFHLAGVNRPKDKGAFMEGNHDFGAALLRLLKKQRNRAAVLLSSSIQADLSGRFADSEYGRSKLAAERLFLKYGEETGAKVLIYRFPNLFGKWCRPNYNSVVATFCHNMANGLPISVDDPAAELSLLYIDDLILGMLDALEGKESRCEYLGHEAVRDANGRYCYVPGAHKVTLGEIARLLEEIHKQPETLWMPEMPERSFAKKLSATYLSYLPQAKAKRALKMNLDERGSFTELLKTASNGQFSVNVSKPGVTKGQHWHHSKWEIFIVVSGRALISERRVGLDEAGNPYPAFHFEVSGEKLEAVYLLPGYTHSIENLSSTDCLVTLMWANEPFDAERPDTFFEIVKQE